MKLLKKSWIQPIYAFTSKSWCTIPVFFYVKTGKYSFFLLKEVKVHCEDLIIQKNFSCINFGNMNMFS